MGSKMSSNQHIAESKADTEAQNLGKPTTSARMDLIERDEAGIMERDEGGGENCQHNDVDQMEKKDNEPAFDINENFDFDSEQVTPDSDVMTMDSICDGFDVVEIGDNKDVGIGKRHRPSKAAIVAGKDISTVDALSNKLRSVQMDAKISNGTLSRSTPLLQTTNEQIAPAVLYKMNYPNRGRVVVVNQTLFQPVTGMSNREGTDSDITGLQRVFGKLEFRVETYHDLSVSEFRRLLHEVSDEDFRDDDCFMFIVMSHGEKGVLYCTDGTVHIDEVPLRFKGDLCPSLVGKPKLFFFQACRGTQMDYGVLVPAVEGDDQPDAAAVKQKMFYTIPVEADFLLAYSSTHGYYSWRSLREGSWFIQALITIAEKYGASMEIMQMMTRVNRTVAYRYESISSDERYNGRKQMPCFISTLTKELYFTSKK